MKAAASASAVLPAPLRGADPEPERAQHRCRAGIKRPLLFRVGKPPSAWYVFGTIHVPDARLDTFPPELDAALRESDTVYTEIPMDDATQVALAPRLMLPEGQSLSALVPPKLYQRVSDAFGAHGIPMAPFDRMKPWAVSVQVAVLDKLFVLAIELPRRGPLPTRGGRGKTVGGLEDPEEQLGLFDELTPKEQVELLRQAVDFRDKVRTEKRDALGELLDAYVAGKDAELLRLVKEDYDPKDALSVKLMKRVFSDRNRSLTERMLARVRAAPEKVQFFAVGSGHLVGDDGIVERLRKQGLTPARVVP